MLSCCARMVPLRGAGGVGDSPLAYWVGYGGFGAGGGRCMSSRISARSAFSFSLSTLAPLPVLSLLRLPLSAHPPAPPPPPPRLFFPHSPHPSSQLPQAVSASPGLSSISHLSHDPFSRPATRWFRPRAVACEKAISVKCCHFLFIASPEIFCFAAGGHRALPCLRFLVSTPVHHSGQHSG